MATSCQYTTQGELVCTSVQTGQRAEHFRTYVPPGNNCTPGRSEDCGVFSKKKTQCLADYKGVPRCIIPIQQGSTCQSSHRINVCSPGLVCKYRGKHKSNICSPK